MCVTLVYSPVIHERVLRVGTLRNARVNSSAMKISCATKLARRCRRSATC